MAATRTETPMNGIVLAALVALQGVSHRKNPAYLTTPKFAKRLHELGDFTGVQAPGLAVSFGEWTAEPQACQRFDATMHLHVDCFAEKKGDPEGELLRLVSDAILALVADVTLGARVQWIFPRSFRPNVDLINRSGKAVATLDCEVLYRFDATAP